MSFGDILSLALLGGTILFLLFFAFPIGTPNNLYVFVSSPINLVWYSILYKYGSRVLKFSSNHSWSISNQRLDLAGFSWKLYYWSFLFPFYHMTPFGGSYPLVHTTLFRSLFFNLPWIHIVYFEVHLNYITLVLKYFWKKYLRTNVR